MCALLLAILCENITTSKSISAEHKQEDYSYIILAQIEKIWKND